MNGLSKSFDGRRRVLDDVELRVNRGEAVALIGANGAGKSTLLRCLVRLIEPDGGRIEVLGNDMSRLRGQSLRRVRSRVGFVFQRHNLVPRLSVLSNVVHGSLAGLGWRAWRQWLAPGEIRARGVSCLGRVGLASLAERRADTLSGGQSQRVAIARALMQRPELLLADEPVASLDPAAGEEAMTLFRDLAARDGITLLFTTHSMTHAVTFADRIVGLRNGRLVLEQPARSASARELERFFA